MVTDVQKRITQYVALRDRIHEIEEKHDIELRPYKDLLDVINAELLAHLDSQKVNSMKTDAGTIYVSERPSATVRDGAAFFDFVRETEGWDLLERRANVTAVRAFIDARIEAAKADANVLPTPPPGVNFSIYRRVGVRRA